MRQVRSLEDAQVAIRELYGLLDKLNSKDIDMSKRRVINASPSRDPYDYVVRKELTDAVSNSTTNIEKSTTESPNIKQVYTVVFCNNGTPRRAYVSSPFYIIKRRSKLTIINIIFHVGPSTGGSAVFQLYKNGTAIVTPNMTVWDTNPIDTAIEYNLFSETTFEVEDVLWIETVQTMGISNVTIELFLEEI